MISRRGRLADDALEFEASAEEKTRRGNRVGCGFEEAIRFGFEAEVDFLLRVVADGREYALRGQILAIKLVIIVTQSKGERIPAQC
jgi:hypothetical protein